MKARSIVQGAVARSKLAIVLIVIALVGWPSSVYLFYQVRHIPLDASRQAQITASFAAAALVSVATWWLGMRTGIRALQEP